MAGIHNPVDVKTPEQRDILGTGRNKMTTSLQLQLKMTSFLASQTADPHFFWWTGLLPDFAMLRDRAVTPFTKRIYSTLSFGWSGRAKDWQRFEEVSLVLAGLATPLVFSVLSPTLLLID